MAPSAQASAVSARAADRYRPTAAHVPRTAAPRQTPSLAVCGLCPHQSTAPSGYTPEVFSVHRPRVVGTANPEHLSKALAHRGGQFLRQTAFGFGRLSGAVVRSNRKVVCHCLPGLRVFTMALEPCPRQGTMAFSGRCRAATPL